MKRKKVEEIERSATGMCIEGTSDILPKDIHEVHTYFQIGVIYEVLQI